MLPINSALRIGSRNHYKRARIGDGAGEESGELVTICAGGQYLINIWCASGRRAVIKYGAAPHTYYHNTAAHVWKDYCRDLKLGSVHVIYINVAGRTPPYRHSCL
jgi:hypothetical protein